MKKIIIALAAPLALASCDSATGGFDGPPALGIVSGNHQVATAGSERLPDPVVGRMVRTPSGGIAFHLVTPAYADEGTVVQGSPIAGAVVCAVATAGELTPFTPCTNTDDHGQARFFFAPGTKAGEARAEIRGTLEGLPAVFDTVVAHVEPGASVGFLSTAQWHDPEVPVDPGMTFDLREGLEGVDEYGNRTDGSDLVTIDEDLVRWRFVDNVVSSQRPCEAVDIEGTGWIVTVPDFEEACFKYLSEGRLQGYHGRFSWTIDGYEGYRQAFFTQRP